MARKSDLDAALEKIDADIENLQAMREYLTAHTAEAAPKPKRTRKKKGLPTDAASL